MREKIAEFIIMFSVAVGGVGQYFNEARLPPKMLANPPDSVIAHNAIPADGGLPFFFPLNPLIFLFRSRLARRLGTGRGRRGNGWF